MIKVRYVAQVEVDAVMLNERVKVPVTEIAERIRGTWITKAIAEQVRGVFDRRADIKVTTQLADVVEIPDEMPDDWSHGCHCMNPIRRRHEQNNENRL